MIDPKCPECGALLKKKDIKNDKCWKCKAINIAEYFKIQEDKAGTELGDDKKMEANDLERDGGMLKKISGYFQFKNMITTSIIKTLYVFGVIGIIMYSIELINESSGYGANEDLKLYGFALLIFGNLFWRLICEGWILFFSIHESLVSIENNTKNN